MHNSALGGGYGRLAWAMGIDYGPLGVPGGRGTLFEGKMNTHSSGRSSCQGPIFRFLVDLQDDPARSVIAGGPSGHVGSGRYVNEVHNWRHCHYKALGAGA